MRAANHLENSRSSDGAVAALALLAVALIGFNLNRSHVPLQVMDLAAAHVLTAHAAAPEVSPVTPVVQRLQPAAPDVSSACKLQRTPLSPRPKLAKS